MLFRASKNKINTALYEEIIRGYFDYLRERCVRTYNGSDLVELMRYSLCIALDLESDINLDKMLYLATGCINEFKIILNKYEIYKTSTYFRQGVLEACVHGMELSRERAGL